MSGQATSVPVDDEDAAPGDDVVSVPPPVNEVPERDRFCDLVLTGGVASGVVYPWAIVELARIYNFRNIGGTSVGAIAAALAAAAEYGRRNGFEAPFEVLRRTPGVLARDVGGGCTRMLSLFQTNADGRRLIGLWGQIFCGRQEPAASNPKCGASAYVPRPLMLAIKAYREPIQKAAFVCGLVVLALTSWSGALDAAPLTALLLAICLGTAGAIVGGVRAIWQDICRGLIDNHYGLCKGSRVETGNAAPGLGALTDWLHKGIQLSAGLAEDADALTFRDLWTAPESSGSGASTYRDGDPPERRSINLQMITTSATHGRPYRLPLDDTTSQLFFLRRDLEGYFPERVLDALVNKARRFTPVAADGLNMKNWHQACSKDVMELPGADLPIVVAARMSLSFPLLFSAVPLWAIDYEAPFGERMLRRCFFTDGGVCSNFPIHLFDASIPRWPTFGFWLDRRTPYRSPKNQDDSDVWLPEFNGQGRGDNWARFDRGPASPRSDRDQQEPSQPFVLGPSLPGFLRAVAGAALDWQDRTSMRLPHVRNRVARLLLLPDEGGLHIGMPGRQILEMANRYGTRAGLLFVHRFKDEGDQPSRAWREQRWVRLNLLVNGLRERLRGFSTAVEWSSRTVTAQHAIESAQTLAPIARSSREEIVSEEEASDLKLALEELARLESELSDIEPAYCGEPKPELRLRPPL